MENPDESEPMSHDIITRTMSLLELDLIKVLQRGGSDSQMFIVLQVKRPEV